MKKVGMGSHKDISCVLQYHLLDIFCPVKIKISITLRRHTKRRALAAVVGASLSILAAVVRQGKRQCVLCSGLSVCLGLCILPSLPKIQPKEMRVKSALPCGKLCPLQKPPSSCIFVCISRRIASAAAHAHRGVRRRRY